MAGALEDCLVVAGGLETVEPKRKVFILFFMPLARPKYHQMMVGQWKWFAKRDICEERMSKRAKPGVRGLLGSGREEKRRGHKVTFNQTISQSDVDLFLIRDDLL